MGIFSGRLPRPPRSAKRQDHGSYPSRCRQVTPRNQALPFHNRRAMSKFRKHNTVSVTLTCFPLPSTAGWQLFPDPGPTLGSLIAFGVKLHSFLKEQHSAFVRFPDVFQILLLGSLSLEGEACSTQPQLAQVPEAPSAGCSLHRTLHLPPARGSKSHLALAGLTGSCCLPCSRWGTGATENSMLQALASQSGAFAP